RNVAGEGLVEDHHQHLVGTEAALVLERQVGEAVQADGRLAATSATLNHHQTRVRAGDELELPAVDQRGDFLEVFVVRVCQGVPHAELAEGPGGLVGTYRAPLPTMQPRRCVVEAEPAALLAAGERPLRSMDAAQLALGDGDAASHL